MTETAGRRRVAPWVALGVAAVIVALVAVFATRDPGTVRAADSPLLGKPAPALTGRTISGGTFDLRDQQGRWVLVNFFATWCPPCQQEHPELVSFAQRHAAIGDAAVVSVLFNDTEDAARAFFARNGGDWPVVTDPGAATAAAYGFLAPPESFLIDPNGYVVSKIIGGVTDERLEALLQEAQAAFAGGAG